MTSVPIQNLKHISHLYTEFSHGTSCKPFTGPGLDCGAPPHALNREQFKATQEEPKRLSLSKKYSSPGCSLCVEVNAWHQPQGKKYLGTQKLRKDLLIPQDYSLALLGCIWDYHSLDLSRLPSKARMLLPSCSSWEPVTISHSTKAAETSSSSQPNFTPSCFRHTYLSDKNATKVSLSCFVCLFVFLFYMIALMAGL